MQKVIRSFRAPGGFTLIELLVVIAIIGILASIVLVSLNSSRTAANDTKAKAQLASVRAAAELLYNNSTNQYGTVTAADATCPNTAGSLSGDTNVRPYLTGMPSGTTIKCAVNAGTSPRTAYAIAASLAGTGTTGDYWCVDSSGANQLINIAVPGSVLVTDSTCTAMALW